MTLLPPMLQSNKLLSDYCTFGIGGPALYYVEAKDVQDLKSALRFCYEQKLPYFILGKGSNCLFDSKGFDGVIIHNKIDYLKQPTPGVFEVGAGYSFSLLGTQTARQGWTGLEFASGIPGSVGGAVFMNAGANGAETSDCLQSVDFLEPQGGTLRLSKDELIFAYRSSSFQKMKGIITGASFKLQPSATARQKQLEIINYRKKTQPYGDMSAGCVFRNPDCGHAGALIDQNGLKGLQIGDAAVSQVHANFIINVNKATSDEVLQLIEVIKKKVKETTGRELESEIRFIAKKGCE